MALTFDNFGLLSPAGGILTTTEVLLNELVMPFGDNSNRNELYQGWLRYNADLGDCLGTSSFTQWVDGSFVSLKPRPNDIDVVTLYDGLRLQQLSSELEPFKKRMAKARYGVDGHFLPLYSAEHRLSVRTTSDLVYWKHAFGTLPKSRNRKSLSKGYLIINFDDHGRATV